MKRPNALRLSREDCHDANIKTRSLEVEVAELISERDGLLAKTLCPDDSETSREHFSELEKTKEKLKNKSEELDELVSEYTKEKRVLIEQIEAYEEELSNMEVLLKSKESQLDDALFSLE